MWLYLLHVLFCVHLLRVFICLCQSLAFFASLYLPLLDITRLYLCLLPLFSCVYCAVLLSFHVFTTCVVEVLVTFYSVCLCVVLVCISLQLVWF